MTEAMTAEAVGGFLDILKLWRGGTISDVMELVEAIKLKDVARIRASVVKIAAAFDFGADAKEIDDIVAGVIAADWPKVVYEAGDAAMKLAVKHMGYVVPESGVPSNGGILVGGPVGERKNFRDMTAAECDQWFAENKGTARTAAKSWLAQRVLSKRCPDILGALDGTATVASLVALTPEQIIKGLNIAIMILTAASIMYPPLGILVTVLKLVLARYESSNPDVGMALVDLLK